MVRLTLSSAVVSIYVVSGMGQCMATAVVYDVTLLLLIFSARSNVSGSGLTMSHHASDNIVRLTQTFNSRTQSLPAA